MNEASAAAAEPGKSLTIWPKIAERRFEHVARDLRARDVETLVCSRSDRGFRLRRFGCDGNGHRRHRFCGKRGRCRRRRVRRRRRWTRRCRQAALVAPAPTAVAGAAKGVAPPAAIGPAETGASGSAGGGRGGVGIHLRGLPSGSPPDDITIRADAGDREETDDDRSGSADRLRRDPPLVLRGARSGGGTTSLGAAGGGITFAIPPATGNSELL